MGTAVFLLPVLGLALYLLYLAGFVTVQSKRALLYLGAPGGKSASFSSCTGYTRRVVRFKDSRPYTLNFRPVLTAGDVSAEILNSSGQIMACLDSGTPSARIMAEKGRRCYLVLRFRSATGSYTISWD